MCVISSSPSHPVHSKPASNAYRQSSLTTYEELIYILLNHIGKSYQYLKSGDFKRDNNLAKTVYIAEPPCL